ncbi:recQ-like DNA helicase BLM [Amia ocellicauda]|uniref:recQ-like DNA helicase BLM n=1 Tax=Amia ocellicauda TaxID=2972642 RepID=UPI0034642A7F
MQVEFYETESASSIKRHKAAVTKNVSKREEMVHKCLQELNDLCKKLGKIFGIHYYNIFSTATLKKIAETLSADPEVLVQINGVTEDKLEKYGAELIELLQKYSEWQLPGKSTPPNGRGGKRKRASAYKKSKTRIGGYSNKQSATKSYGNGNSWTSSKGGSRARNRNAAGNSKPAMVAPAGKRPGFMAPPLPRTNQRPFLKPHFSHA